MNQIRNITLSFLKISLNTSFFRCIVPGFLVLAGVIGLSVPDARAQTTVNPCPRAQPGADAARPPDLYSDKGVLTVKFDYWTGMDDAGRTLFCFKTPDGLESPTLHVNPGDTLDLTVTNRVPALPSGSPTETISVASNVCGDKTMTETSVNVHFHGTNTAPQCHSDEVIRTLINSGQTFHYSVKFPDNEPPGLYWYHPHVHGIAETAVLGGASGAIVVEGIDALQPDVRGLPEKMLVIRDQSVGASPVASVPVPAWDVSLNYVPVSYPSYKPAVLDLAGKREFWRVLNAAADTIIDLEVRYDGQAQPLEVVALDGVPTGSQDGTRRGKSVTMSHVLLPPAGRAEFIVTGPEHGVKVARLVTRNINTGPDGDFDPERPLAVLETSATTHAAMAVMSTTSRSSWAQRFEGLAAAPVSAKRKLYFSEVISDPSNPASATNFFITVDGQTPTLFDPTNPPAITTVQGAVEDWTIENRSGENHEFHMHQIHFLLKERNGVRVAADRQQMRDTIQVPYWSGTGPYPSVTVRMDFRGQVVGDFVYHCHILGHEDGGMMAIVRVLAKP